MNRVLGALRNTAVAVGCAFSGAYDRVSNHVSYAVVSVVECAAPVARRVRSSACAAAVALAMVFACATVSFAQDSGVTLPTLGVSVADYITAGITALATTVAVAVGGYVAFAIVKRGLAWLSGALGGSHR